MDEQAAELLIFDILAIFGWGCVLPDEAPKLIKAKTKLEAYCMEQQLKPLQKLSAIAHQHADYLLPRAAILDVMAELQSSIKEKGAGDE